MSDKKGHFLVFLSYLHIYCRSDEFFCGFSQQPTSGFHGFHTVSDNSALWRFEDASTIDGVLLLLVEMLSSLLLFVVQVPNVVFITTVAGFSAIAGVPTVAGVPAVAGVLAVASVLANYGVSFLVVFFTWGSDYQITAIGL
jgi:hypothetical protein